MKQINTLWPEWEIVEKIGQGTYGIVYKIEKQNMLGTEQAALKLISLPRSEDDLYMLRHSGMDEQTVSQTLQKQVVSILQEYKLMRTLRDVPGVVHCDNYGYVPHADGMGWDIHIQMELLTPFLRQKELIQDEADIIRFGLELCQTLEACHAHGIIHRDIKPHNIFVTDDGRYKLGDFGIARFSEGTSTATMGAGTLSFMAPEVFNGKRYNHTVDLYSLGMVLYWLLNDRRFPFQASSAAREDANIGRFAGKPLPPPKHGSPALRHIVLKACAYEPENRFCSAAEMRSALKALEQDAPAPIPAPEIPEPVSADPAEEMFDDRTLGIFYTPDPGSRLPLSPPEPEPAAAPAEEMFDDRTLGIFYSPDPGSRLPLSPPEPEPAAAPADELPPLKETVPAPQETAVSSLAKPGLPLSHPEPESAAAPADELPPLKEAVPAPQKNADFPMPKPKRKLPRILAGCAVLSLLMYLSVPHDRTGPGYINPNICPPESHDWLYPPCVNTTACARCGTTKGPQGHDWQEATCLTARTCAQCGETEGYVLGHDWELATCTTPRTCSRCDKSVGTPPGHDWQDATIDTPRTCAKCGQTEGESLPSSED